MRLFTAMAFMSPWPWQDRKRFRVTNPSGRNVRKESKCEIWQGGQLPAQSAHSAEPRMSQKGHVWTWPSAQKRDAYP
jgi:hypothetical protein